jgi:hypothetical protein
MIFGLKAKAAVAAIAVTAAFGSGWIVKGKFEDSKDLAALQAQNALADEIRAGQARISKQVEQRLSELRANERIIDRGVIREIQKPIYKRVCFEPELVRLLNDAARGEAAREPDGQSSEPVADDE